jgi:SAM-dependent methyltransferase
MTVPSFADQREAWSRLPVDDRGYLHTDQLLAMTDGELLALVADMERVRYQGWRNHQNRWRDTLGLDTTHGKVVLDYGCGVGLEALQYARAGNAVVVADINPAAVTVAGRVLAAHDLPALDGAVIGDPATLEPSFPARWFDIVHLAGVLHHIPDPRPTVELAHRLLKPNGELRLMVYSDQAWRAAVGTDPPFDVAADPDLGRYVRTMDEVGDWADWYDRKRLEVRFGDLFTVGRCEYLTPDGRYLAAVLDPRGKR